MRKLSSLWSVLVAIVIASFSAQAQDNAASMVSGIDVSELQTTAVAKAAKSAESVSEYVPALQMKAVNDFKAPEASAAQQKGEKKAPRKVATKGNAEGSYVLVGSSLLTTGYNGTVVTITPLGTDSVILTNFWAKGAVVKAAVDHYSGDLFIPRQVVAQHETYGDIVLAACDMSTGQPLDDADIICYLGDGEISVATPWGAYVKATSTATTWSFLSAVQNARMVKTNATFTGKKHSDGSIENYELVYNKTADNTAEIYNLGNYGQIVKVKLNRDNTVSIPSSLIAYNSTYGDFYSYNLTYSETGASLSANDAVATAAADKKSVSWNNWGVVTGSTSGSRYLVSTYDSCSVTFNEGFTFPELTVTDFVGAGTEADPYQIKTRDDMILLSDKAAAVELNYPADAPTYARVYEGKYFKVMNDIDMGGYSFDPIGLDGIHHFAGVFDGDNHSISNFVVDKKGPFVALFSVVDTCGVVKNLYIENAEFNNTSMSSYTGSVAGYALGTLNNIHVRNVSVYSSGILVGGIAGATDMPIENVHIASAKVTGLYGYTGGVVGELHGKMNNCSALDMVIVSASVSGATPGYPCGGLVGNQYLCDITNSGFGGVIDAYSQRSEYQTIGGIAGRTNGAKISNCVAVAEISTYSSGAMAGGISGYLLGDMDHCFFNGNLNSMSTRAAGGLVGRLVHFTVNGVDSEASIKQCLSAASVDAETYQYQSQANVQHNEVIGQVMEGAAPVIENVYYDKQVVNITKSAYGANTADLISAAGPAGFDSQWKIEEGYYPIPVEIANDAPAQYTAFATAAIAMPAGSSLEMFCKNAPVNVKDGVRLFYLKDHMLSNSGYFSSFDADMKNIVLNTENKFGNDTIAFVCEGTQMSYTRLLKVAPVPFDGGGVEENPFLIKTKADLILLSQLTTVNNQLFPGVYFKIENDIDLEYDTQFLGICTNAANAHQYFAGVLDGAGHTIHKMKFRSTGWTVSPEEAGNDFPQINYDLSTAYKGLVGRLEASGVVKNVNIAADCDLVFYASSGAVVGYNAGTVENCRNYADVTGYSCWIGGISGQNLKEGKIKGCYNSGNVTTGYGSVAGIVGSNVGYVENCMNVGRIEAKQLSTSYTNQLTSVGGIVGSSSAGGKYVNCANAGAIHATAKRAGGIVGFWTTSVSSASSYYSNDVINCVSYGTAMTDNLATLGAIAGGDATCTAGEVSGVYYDAQILDVPADCNTEHEGMTGVETSVLTSGTPLKDFDTEIWQFEAGKYPVLKAFANEEMAQRAATTQLTIPAGVTHKNLTADAVVTAGTPSLAQGTKFVLNGMTVKGIPTTEEVVTDTLTIENNGFVKIITLSALPLNPLTGEGTEANPWKITTPEEWNAFASYVSKTSSDMLGEYVALGNDIDFTGKDAIIPIGGDGVTPFSGFFDGSDHVVKGYEYTTTAAGQGGLFGTITPEGVVKNLIAAGNTNAGLGGTKGTTKFGYVGGVVGKLYGKLENVQHAGKVTGLTTYTAGIAAYVYQEAKLVKCINSGEVTSAAANIGGVAAYVYEGAVFEECSNVADLSSTVATAYVGGIAAASLPATYIKCSNDGEINAAVSAGIVANCSGKKDVGPYKFIECTNYGSITGANTLGGITAMQSSTVGNSVCEYVNCVNDGDITATSETAVSSSSTAGIAAFHSAGSTFNSCINYGNITNTKSVYTAGIAGNYKGAANATYPEKFVNCVNSGNIASQGQQIAGIVAYVSNFVEMDSCVNYGDIEQGTWGAAGVAYTFNGANSVMRRCLNYGDITVGTYNAGGVVGNNAQPATVIEQCANFGQVSSLSDTITGYGVGGVVASAYCTVKDCANYGNVTGRLRVGGIVGSPSHNATTARTQLVNCYSIGAVKGAEGAAGALIGTDPSKPDTYWGDNNSVTNCYYLTDKESIGDNNEVGTGVMVRELVGVNMNASSAPTDGVMAVEGEGEDAWSQYDGYSFPVLTAFKDNDVMKVACAAVVVAEGDSLLNITNPQFNVGGADNQVVWTARLVEDESVAAPIAFDGSDASVTEKSEGVDVILTATLNNIYREWKVRLNVAEISGVNDIDANASLVGEKYFNINGVEVSKPTQADGQVYIVVRQYTNGQTEAVKVLNK